MAFRRSGAGGVVFALLLPLATACSLFTSLSGLTGGSGSADSGAGSGSDASRSEDSGVILPLLDGAAGSPHDAATTTTDAEAAAPVVCTDGGTVCNGACVDPTSDPMNCNGCGNVCTSGLCGTTIAATMASQPPNWMFNGSATYNSFAPSAQLTAAEMTDQAGTAVYANPVAIDTMEVEFEFRIGLNGGTRSDGMGFMIEQTGAIAVGGNGGSLGMAGLTGFGVELDIHDNGACGDTSDDHVGVDTLTSCVDLAGQPTSLSALDLTGSLDLGDTHWHTADITLAAGLVTVLLDGTTELAGVRLTGFTSGASYYVGFAGATGGLVLPDGGGGYRQEVKDVTIDFPTPRCL